MPNPTGKPKHEWQALYIAFQNARRRAPDLSLKQFNRDLPDDQRPDYEYMTERFKDIAQEMSNFTKGQLNYHAPRAIDALAIIGAESEDEKVRVAANKAIVDAWVKLQQDHGLKIHADGGATIVLFSREDAKLAEGMFGRVVDEKPDEGETPDE